MRACVRACVCVCVRVCVCGQERERRGERERERERERETDRQTERQRNREQSKETSRYAISRSMASHWRAPARGPALLFRVSVPKMSPLRCRAPPRVPESAPLPFPTTIRCPALSASRNARAGPGAPRAPSGTQPLTQIYDAELEQLWQARPRARGGVEPPAIPRTLRRPGPPAPSLAGEGWRGPRPARLAAWAGPAGRLRPGPVRAGRLVHSVRVSDTAAPQSHETRRDAITARPGPGGARISVGPGLGPGGPRAGAGPEAGCHAGGRRDIRPIRVTRHERGDFRLRDMTA